MRGGNRRNLCPKIILTENKSRIPQPGIMVHGVLGVVTTDHVTIKKTKHGRHAEDVNRDFAVSFDENTVYKRSENGDGN